ncbi:hypothetical protein [Curtobacterium ammoniigenes]|uniref:hypothetical protein n=1 Tax=Curtobacterium ammoniigenes TaxID=395387 RepID=UPI00082B7B74|nr:hypothetical protein [Curtobacterium ammoniigenes]
MSAIPGQIILTERALASCARAVAAERLGASPARVRVTLEDAHGELAIGVVGPIASGADLITRAGAVAAGIREHLGTLTGRAVGSARLELTGVVSAPRTRVK